MCNHKGFTCWRYGGFTLIELLVVIAIIAILMAILMPSLMRVREQAREVMCRANLRQYGLAQTMYLDDFDNRYPSAWTSLVKTEQPVPGYERYCRWHDPRYPPDGPFWPYLVDKNINLCPSFKVLAKYLGQDHPNHVASNPVVPFYNYSMIPIVFNTCAAVISTEVPTRRDEVEKSTKRQISRLAFGSLEMTNMRINFLQLV